MNTTTKTQESKPEVLTLAEQIGALHRDIEGRYSEMHSLLSQARQAAGEDGWSKWLAANREVLGFGERQAQRYLRSPALRKADTAANREAVAAHRERKRLHVVPPVEKAEQPEIDEAIKVLKSTAPTKAQKEATTELSPAPPKKFKLGSTKWVQEQVDAISLASSNLQCVYPKLTGRQAVLIGGSQKALERVLRIGSDFDRVNQDSLELVQVWNRQGGEQVEANGYLLNRLREAVACEPDLDRWIRLIKKIAEVDCSWVTLENFEGLISTWEGRPDGLEDLEKQEGLPAWESEASESVEVSHDGDQVEPEP